MKSAKALLPALLTVGGVATGHLATRPALDASQAAAQDLTVRVERLESELDVAREQLETVALDVAEQRALVDQAVHYIGRQALQAKGMEGVLAESEKLGFTAGINPRSREVLLAGLRKQLAEAQHGVPGESQPPGPEAPPKR